MWRSWAGSPIATEELQDTGGCDINALEKLGIGEQEDCEVCDRAVAI